jgi:phosphopantetheine adenylyltransferase
MSNQKKTVYVPLAVDFIHSGHLNIIKVAKKYGKVIIGLLTDEAISQYKRLPILTQSKPGQLSFIMFKIFLTETISLFLGPKLKE